MHPEEHDSGTVALIAIAVLTTILVIASIVSVHIHRIPLVVIVAKLNFPWLQFINGNN